MTLTHLFIAWVCVTLYLSVVFFYEMWRYRKGDYDMPKPVIRTDERPKTPAPRSEPAKAPVVAPEPSRSPQAARQNPAAERHEELIDWLMDHKKRECVR